MPRNPTPAQTAASRATITAATAAAQSAAAQRRAAGLPAARWPTGPGPLRHGASSRMTKRCRTENGVACQTCKDGEAVRKRAERALTTDVKAGIADPARPVCPPMSRVREKVGAP